MSFGSLQGQRIVITGSSSGIGRAIALECAAAGADIVVHCHRSLRQAHEVADAAGQHGVQALVLAADLSSAAQQQEFARACFESGPVTAIVNNAGADLLTTPLRDATFSQKLLLLLQTDVTATIELSRIFGGRFRESGGGSVLNVGWDQADRGMEGDSGELFAAAKNAVMGFTRSLALSLAPQVRVNCVAPGWIRTAWGAGAGEYWQQRVVSETPLRRWGEPQDIASLARFLLSDQSSYITGQVINVNGGAVR